MPLITIDFTQNSPYRIMQHGVSRKLLGYVFLPVGFRNLQSKVTYVFLAVDGCGGLFRIIVWDKPQMIESRASLNEIVRINSAGTIYNRRQLEIGVEDQISLFELHVHDASQIEFYGQLDERELAILPNYRLSIEDEENI